MITLSRPFYTSPGYRHLLILIGIVTVFCCCTAPAKLEDSNSVTFKTIKKIPVVEGKINGKRALFIVDTGASVSILNESLSKRFGFKYLSAPSTQRVLGLGGQASMKIAFNCDVEFGNIRLNGVRFHSKPLGEVLSAIRENEEIEIAGIIGGNIIQQYGITINYRNSTISF